MRKGFLDFVDKFEEKLLAEGEDLEEYEYYDMVYGKDHGEKDEEVETETITEREDLDTFKINDSKIKRKLCYELNNFGLNKSTISKIIENVFTGDDIVYEEEAISQKTKKPKGNFKRKSNRIKSNIAEKVDNSAMGHAASILEGMDDMTSPNAPVDHGPLTTDEYGRPDVSNFDMDNTAEHASALL
jgi:hypothetical protein